MAPASSSAAARGAKVSSSSSQPSSLPSTPYRQPSSSTDDLAQPLCLPTPAAGPLTRTLHHLYPIALAVVFVRRFPSLVSDPDAELGGTLTAALLGIQAAWLVVCVPTAGSTSAAASKKSRLGASGRRKASEKDGARSGLGWFVMIVGVSSCPLFCILPPFLSVRRPDKPNLHDISTGPPRLTHPGPTPSHAHHPLYPCPLWRPVPPTRAPDAPPGPAYFSLYSAPCCVLTRHGNDHVDGCGPLEQDVTRCHRGRIRVGRLGSLARCHPHPSRLGPRLAGMAGHGTCRCVDGVRRWCRAGWDRALGLAAWALFREKLEG